MKIPEQQLLELRTRMEKLVTEREVILIQSKTNSTGDYSNALSNVHKKLEELENHIAWLGDK